MCMAVCLCPLTSCTRYQRYSESTSIIMLCLLTVLSRACSIVVATVRPYKNRVENPNSYENKMLINRIKIKKEVQCIKAAQVSIAIESNFVGVELFHKKVSVQRY